MICTSADGDRRYRVHNNISSSAGGVASSSPARSVVSSLRVFTKNACISSSKRLAVVLSELQSVSWHIVLFSETRAASRSVVLDGGHKLFAFLGDHRYAGVDILVHADLVGDVYRVHRVSGRVLAIDLRRGGCVFRIVSVYCPHGGYEITDLEEMYHQLHVLFLEAQRRNFRIIIGGDFNIVVGVGDRGTLFNDFLHTFGL